MNKRDYRHGYAIGKREAKETGLGQLLAAEHSEYCVVMRITGSLAAGYNDGLRGLPKDPR